jgi:Na+-transporting NADH:ubiquinone oxidoreductase subunit NqrE
MNPLEVVILSAILDTIYYLKQGIYLPTISILFVIFDVVFWINADSYNFKVKEM